MLLHTLIRIVIILNLH